MLLHCAHHRPSHDRSAKNRMHVSHCSSEPVASFSLAPRLAYTRFAQPPSARCAALPTDRDPRTRSFRRPAAEPPTLGGGARGPQKLLARGPAAALSRGRDQPTRARLPRMSPTQSAGAQLHPRSRPFWGAGWPRCMQDSLNVSAWGVCSRISLQQLSSSEILRTCPPPWFCESHPSCCRILLENFIFMFRSVRLAPEIRFRKLCESCRIMQNSLALPDTTAVLRSYPYRIRTGSYPYLSTAVQ